MLQSAHACPVSSAGCCQRRSRPAARALQPLWSPTPDALNPRQGGSSPTKGPQVLTSRSGLL